MITEIIKAVILGLVEGLTEFLPISSTGHLILVNQWVYFTKQFTNLFDIVIQLGAILAVVVYFWKKLWNFDLWVKAIIGVIPAIIFGALFASKIEAKFFNPWTVAIALLLGGIIILYIESKQKQAKITSVAQLSYKTAFLIGLVQCLSLIPGTSRSASTIIGAIIFGCSRVVATEFSFFLAIPTMIAASAWSLLKYHAILNSSQVLILAVGFIVSFLAALAVIKFILDFVKKHDFKVFGWYRIVLGAIIIIYFLVK